MIKRMVAVFMAVVVAGGVLMSSHSALAAPGDGAPVDVQAPMTVVGFDSAVAARNGYPTKAPQVAAAPVATSGEIVTGNCGFSFVHLSDVGDKKYTVHTGFGVPFPAVGYSWQVNVIGPGRNHTHTWGGGLLFSTTWEGYATHLVGKQGWFTAKASGKAVLSNGWICQSAGPFSNALIL